MAEKETTKPVGMGVDQPVKPGDGLRSVRTTGVFRAVNFELYAKPNRFVMAVGLIAISGCIGYLTWMRQQHKEMNVYTALDENDQLYLRQKKSRWD